MAPGKRAGGRKASLEVRVKRVYDAPSREDGARVLVDRLWPRGLTKEKAAVERWLREVAPSAELRRWFGHDPERWDAFRARYRKELAAHKDALAELRGLARERGLTLLFAARDEAHNDAVVLRDVLLGPGARRP